MTSIAVTLHIVGAVLAIAGPAIAAFRLATKAEKAKAYVGTYDDVAKATSAAVVQADARREAWWSIAEFGLVGLGVAISSATSIVLVPGF